MTPQSIAHYRILSKLGEGGMGAVYRATDTKLNRDVAIKILPEAFAADPDRFARFTREAQLLAALNHPNIATIFGIEECAIVMELVDGPTLADRIAQGPIPILEALPIARQIAEALKIAHEKGIVHRDLKPANVKIASDGTVKVLDFGLAKLSDPAASQSTSPSPSAQSLPPTLVKGQSPTMAGMILGTAGYMSPEQAAGQTVDRRADIWAFGVVLWEMLSGAALFQGETVMHALADVMRAPIDFQRLPPSTPNPIRNLITRCLDRNLKRRLQDIGEATFLLDEFLTNPTPTPTPAATTKTTSHRLPWLACAITATLLAILAFIHFREQSPQPSLIRFQIPGPQNPRYSGASLSPNGRTIAFTDRDTAGKAHIWVRTLDSLETRPLPGTEDALNFPVFWSPDSRYIGFATAASFAPTGKLKKIDVSGGPAQTICSIPLPFFGGAWTPDGAILFATAQALMRVPDSGGTPSPLPANRPTKLLSFPTLLPGASHYLAVQSSGGPTSIIIGSLDGKPVPFDKPLFTRDGRLSIAYAPSPNPSLGYVLFPHENSLMAIPFDHHRLQPTGPPVPIIDSVNIGIGSFAASANGTLAYLPANPSESRLLWFDRQGKQLGQIGPPGAYGQVQLSPDGKLLIVDQASTGRGHTFAADTLRAVFSRVTLGDTDDYAGVASPDGRVAFTYTPNKVRGDIYLSLASGAGAPQPLVQSPTTKHPNDWSIDGRFLIYDDHTDQRQDLWILPMSNTSTPPKPIPFLTTPADETDATFSPDSRWVAYSSDESGRREIYVRGFLPDRTPSAAIGKWQISTAGGAKPRWRRDGKELFYIAGDRKLMAVPVKSTPTTFDPGVPIPLFDAPLSNAYLPYAVSPDGRFLFSAAHEVTANRPITVILNWTAGLRN